MQIPPHDCQLMTDALQAVEFMGGGKGAELMAGSTTCLQLEVQAPTFY